MMYAYEFAVFAEALLGPRGKSATQLQRVVECARSTPAPVYVCVCVLHFTPFRIRQPI